MRTNPLSVVPSTMIATSTAPKIESSRRGEATKVVIIWIPRDAIVNPALPHLLLEAIQLPVVGPPPVDQAPVDPLAGSRRAAHGEPQPGAAVRVAARLRASGGHSGHLRRLADGVLVAQYSSDH